jgi:hypothetical protein
VKHAESYINTNTTLCNVQWVRYVEYSIGYHCMFERYVLFHLTIVEPVDIEPLAIRQYTKHYTLLGYKSLTNAVHRRYRIQLQTVPVMS